MIYQKITVQKQSETPTALFRPLWKCSLLISVLRPPSRPGRNLSCTPHPIDRNGNEADITNYRKAYPVKEPYAGVQKFYTKVPHKENSLTAGSINNNVWKEAVTVNESLYPYEENKMINCLWSIQG